MTGREQTRRNAIAWLERNRDSKSPSIAQIHASTILAELEQAERERDEAREHADRWLSASGEAQSLLLHDELLLEGTRQLEYSDAAVLSLTQRLAAAEARLVPVPALVEALRELLSDDDMPRHWDADEASGAPECVCSYCVRLRAVRAALTVYEQSQGKP